MHAFQGADVARVASELGIAVTAPAPAHLVQIFAEESLDLNAVLGPALSKNEGIAVLEVLRVC